MKFNYLRSFFRNYSTPQEIINLDFLDHFRKIYPTQNNMMGMNDSISTAINLKKYLDKYHNQLNSEVLYVTGEEALFGAVAVVKVNDYILDLSQNKPVVKTYNDFMSKWTIINEK